MKSVFLLVSLAAALGAQSADPTLQSLLAEVHQLRLALERSTSIGPRIQIVVERMNLQQGVVSQLAKQAEDAKREVEMMTPVVGQSTGRSRELESELTSQSDPANRKKIEAELRELKAQAERMQQMEQAARTRIADTQNRVRTEQANLDVLTKRQAQSNREGAGSALSLTSQGWRSGRRSRGARMGTVRAAPSQPRWLGSRCGGRGLPGLNWWRLHRAPGSTSRR